MFQRRQWPPYRAPLSSFTFSVVVVAATTGSNSSGAHRLPATNTMPPKNKKKGGDDGDAKFMRAARFGRVKNDLKMGFVGLPNVGKSTLTNILAGACHAEAANYVRSILIHCSLIGDSSCLILCVVLHYIFSSLSCVRCAALLHN